MKADLNVTGASLTGILGEKSFFLLLLIYFKRRLIAAVFEEFCNNPEKYVHLFLCTLSLKKTDAASINKFIIILVV